MIQSNNSDRPPHGLIYRIFRIITVVHPGELTRTLLLSFNIFLILAAYYMLKIVRDATILDEYGEVTKSMMSGIQVILLIFVIKAYSSLASRVDRGKLISRVTLFFILNLGVIYILFVTGLFGRVMSLVYFVWMGIFNLMVIAQFWGFTNDLYSEEAGKRLFPVIMFGANLGGFAGALFSKKLIDPKEVNPILVYQLILIAAALLGACILLTKFINKRELNRQQNIPEKEIKKDPLKEDVEKPLKKEGGFKLVFKSRYLLYIAFFVLLLNVINTNGEYILDSVFKTTTNSAVQTGEIVQEASLAKLANLKSNFFLIVNFLTLFIQVFIVSRLFKWFGVRVAVFVLPFIALGGNIAMSMGASLLVVGWAKAFENSTDYSLTNTTRHALFLITSREEKYKAKAAIDAFFHRAGDVGSTLFVLLGTTLLALSTESFARINMVVAIVWIFLCFLIAKEHKKIKRKTISDP